MGLSHMLMARYAIIGLECSVTKALSRIVARNVSPSLTYREGHKKPKGFDGHKNIGDEHNFVQHYKRIDILHERSYQPDLSASELREINKRKKKLQSI